MTRATRLSAKADAQPSKVAITTRMNVRNMPMWTFGPIGALEITQDNRASEELYDMAHTAIFILSCRIVAFRTGRRWRDLHRSRSLGKKGGAIGPSCGRFARSTVAGQ